MIVYFWGGNPIRPSKPVYGGRWDDRWFISHPEITTRGQPRYLMGCKHKRYYYRRAYRGHMQQRHVPCPKQ